MGYGHCPDILMEEDYKRHLPDLLKRAATRAERIALNALPLAPLARGWLEVRMTFQALRHLGLDEVQVRTLLRRHRAKAIAFWRFVKQLADEVVRDHEVAVGSQMTFRARHAARYDLFAVLTKVVQLLTGPTRTARQRALRLLPVLRPESDQIGLDLARALTLVEHVDALTALAYNFTTSANGRHDAARLKPHTHQPHQRAGALRSWPANLRHVALHFLCKIRHHACPHQGLNHSMDRHPAQNPAPGSSSRLACPALPG
jgi:hypothetical protein